MDRYRGSIFRTRWQRNAIAIILTLWAVGIAYELATGRTDVGEWGEYNWPAW